MYKIEDFFTSHNELLSCKSSIIAAKDALVVTFKNRNKLLLCGNGGSACDAEHIAGELMKGFLHQRPLNEDQKHSLVSAGDNGYIANKLQNGLPCIVLSGLLGASTAFANDVDPILCYAQQAFVYAEKGDILLAISTSGNAENVYHAAVAAKAKGAKIISLTGKDGGRLKYISDMAILAPETETWKIQELHIAIYHALCASIEEEIFGNGTVWN